MKNKRFLMKLFLTIVGLICVPLMSLQMIMVEWSTKEYRNNNISNYYSVLQSGADIFDRQLTSLSKIALQMSLSNDVKQPLNGRGEENYYSLYVAAQAIDRFANGYPLIDAAGVYYMSGGYMLYDQYHNTVPRFCETVAQDSDECEAALTAFFENLSGLEMFSTSGYQGISKNTVIVAKPVSLTFRIAPDAVVFFTIDHDDLVQACLPVLSDQVELSVIGKTGKILLRGDGLTDTLFASQEFQEFLGEEEKSVFSPGNIDADFVIYKYTQPQSEYVFLLTVKESAAEMNLKDYISRMQLIMVLSAGLICVLLAVTLYINYKPIHQLVEKHLGEKKAQNKSELELIDSAFFALDERITSQSDMLLNMRISELLNDNTRVTRNLFPDKYAYFLVLLALCPQPTAEQAEKIISRAVISTNDKMVITSVPYRSHTVVVYLSSERIETAMLAESLRLSLETILGTQCDVYPGKQVTQPENLRNSYFDALSVFREAGKVEFAGEALYPADELHEFIQAVYSFNAEQLCEALCKVEERLNSAEMSGALRQYYCFSLLNGYLTCLRKLNISLENEETERLLSFGDPASLLRMLRQSVTINCHRQEQYQKDAAAHMKKKLILYVDENFSDPTMSLHSAAEYLQTSIYYVSRIFKEATGTGFKEYVNNKRLEYACDLLRNTTDSIAVITEKAGFENPTYFSTIFKSRFGMPPSKYRRNG